MGFPSMQINKVRETDWRRGWGLGFSRKGSLAWAGVARIPRLFPQVLGTRVTRPGAETLHIDSRVWDVSGGVWPSDKVMFQDGQGGCGLSVLEGNESSQLPTGS